MCLRWIQATGLVPSKEPLLAASYCCIAFYSILILDSIAIKMGDSTVVELLHVGRDWSELTLVCWQPILRITSLYLVEQNSFDVSFVFEIFAVQWLVAVFLYALGSHVELGRFLLK